MKVRTIVMGMVVGIASGVSVPLRAAGQMIEGMPASEYGHWRTKRDTWLMQERNRVLAAIEVDRALVQEGRRAVVAHLVGAGADPRALNKDGLTAREIAERTGNALVALWLLRWEAQMQGGKGRYKAERRIQDAQERVIAKKKLSEKRDRSACPGWIGGLLRKVLCAAGILSPLPCTAPSRCGALPQEQVQKQFVDILTTVNRLQYDTSSHEVYRRYKAKLEEAIAAGADSDAPSFFADRPALHYVIQSFEPEKAIPWTVLLLGLNADPDARAGDGDEPLHAAARMPSYCTNDLPHILVPVFKRAQGNLSKPLPHASWGKGLYPGQELEPVIKPSWWRISFLE